MVYNTHLISPTRVVATRCYNGHSLWLWCNIIFQTNTRPCEWLWCQTITQLHGQCSVVLSHASAEKFDARIPTNGRLEHISPTRFKLYKWQISNQRTCIIRLCFDTCRAQANAFHCGIMHVDGPHSFTSCRPVKPGSKTFLYYSEPQCVLLKGTRKYLEGQHEPCESILERRSEPPRPLRDYSFGRVPTVYCWNLSKTTSWSNRVGMVHQLLENLIKVFNLFVIFLRYVNYHLQSNWPQEPHLAGQHNCPVVPIRKRIR